MVVSLSRSCVLRIRMALSRLVPTILLPEADDLGVFPALQPLDGLEFWNELDAGLVGPHV
jgi:hypothetical protein